MLIAFLIRGLTGFGSGLLAVPMLLLFLNRRLVVPTAASLAVLSGILLILTFKTRKWVRKDALLMLVGGAILGTPVGTYILASYTSSLLERLFGLLISGYALRLLFWDKESNREIKNYVGLIAGFLGGCLGGMFAAGGPPVIIYLNRQIDDKRAFRATLTLYFLIANSWQYVTYLYAGLITGEVLMFTAWMLPFFAIGSIAGSFMHIKINQVLFDRVVALVLLITGIMLMLNLRHVQ